MYSSEFMGKYVKVIDRRNDSVIASGKVIGSKNDFENGGISFDCKWFFRETEHLKYEIVDFCETKLLEQDPKELGLIWDFLFVENKEVAGLDVRRDYGYDELDPEIADYIYKLNEITEALCTTTSCCGHGIKPWYIEFEFRDFDIMSMFINIVEYFEGKLILVSSGSAGKQIKKKNIHLILKPTVDDYDFKLLDKFCRKLTIALRG